MASQVKILEQDGVPQSMVCVCTSLSELMDMLISVTVSQAHHSQSMRVQLLQRSTPGMSSCNCTAVRSATPGLKYMFPTPRCEGGGGGGQLFLPACMHNTPRPRRLQSTALSQVSPHQ